MEITSKLASRKPRDSTTLPTRGPAHLSEKPDASAAEAAIIRRAERYQLPGEPGRRVGARQSRVVRAKPSASAGERSPGGRLDAGAAGAQVPE